MPKGMTLFDTAIGTCGLAWTARGIDRLILPMADRDATRAALAAHDPTRAIHARPPAELRPAVQRMRRHLRGLSDPLTDIAVDLAAASPFARKIYRTLRRIPPGETITYGELAHRARTPGAVRAVGRTLGANPVALLVPCHRVIAADGRGGGFTAHGGILTKIRLLHAEGVTLDPNHAAGLAHLRRVDRRIARIIRRTGPYLAPYGADQDPYDELVGAIVYQQLSLKAAATIARRVRALTPGTGYPGPAEIAALRDDELRAAGLSRQKISYLRDLAAHILAGDLRLERLRRMNDAAVIDALCQVKGIGEWSAHMFLLFHLGRLDILPIGDLGLRTAVKVIYELEDVPSPGEVERMGALWRPYRSMATWYLWQGLRQARSA